jgi:hypothetical protein
LGCKDDQWFSLNCKEDWLSLLLLPHRLEKSFHKSWGKRMTSNDSLSLVARIFAQILPRKKKKIGKSFLCATMSSFVYKNSFGCG